MARSHVIVAFWLALAVPFAGAAGRSGQTLPFSRPAAGGPAASRATIARAEARRAIAPDDGLASPRYSCTRPGLLHGGPPIVLQSALGYYSAGELVTVYFGTVATGTVVLTNAKVLADGQLRATVSVPQAFPGTYGIVAIGQSSGRAADGLVTLVPVLHPALTSAAAGTVATLLQARGFCPTSPWMCSGVGPARKALERLLIPGWLTIVAVWGSWSSFIVSGTAGTYLVAGVGRFSGAYDWFSFTVLPALTLSPPLGSAGSSVIVSGRGYSQIHPSVSHSIWPGRSG